MEVIELKGVVIACKEAGIQNYKRLLFFTLCWTLPQIQVLCQTCRGGHRLEKANSQSHKKISHQLALSEPLKLEDRNHILQRFWFTHPNISSDLGKVVDEYSPCRRLLEWHAR